MSPLPVGLLMCPQASLLNPTALTELVQQPAVEASDHTGELPVVTVWNLMSLMQIGIADMLHLSSFGN